MTQQEEYLVYAWNDYISEVDEAPEPATCMADVDLNLEGFRERFEYEIYLYENDL